jgi:phosphoglycolate phosphatase
VQKNKTIKAILFDKDGTIFDYSRVWFSVLKNSVDIVFEKEGIGYKQHIKDLIMELMGLDEHGKTHSEGAIFSHDKWTIFKNAMIFSWKAKMFPHTVARISNDIMKCNDKYIGEKLESLDFRKQQELFKTLKEMGYIIGIITVDRTSSLEIFINDMGIKQYIDFTSTRDDHLPSKPNPKSFLTFCDQFSLDPEEVAFVGDTTTDMKFAKKANSGLKIAVEWGGYTKEELCNVSDVVYETLFGIYDNELIFPNNNSNNFSLKNLKK